MIEFRLASISQSIARSKQVLWNSDAKTIAISQSNFAQVLSAFSALPMLEASAFLAYAMPLASPSMRFFGKAMLACRKDKQAILKEYRIMVSGDES